MLLPGVNLMFPRKFLGGILAYGYVALLGLALTMGVIYVASPPAEMRQAAVQFVSTLVGVLLAFALADESERRIQARVYAAELNAAVDDLAGLKVVCSRVVAELQASARVVDEMSRPPSIMNLQQSSRFRAHAGYPLRAGLTSVLTAIDVVRPQIEYLRTAAGDDGQRVKTARSIDALGKLVVLLQPHISRELDRG